MLTRNNNVSSPDKYYNDTLLTTPTYKQSIYDNFAAGVATPVAMTDVLNDTYGKTPDGVAIKSTLDAAEIGNEAPGTSWTQWGAENIANMAGQALNPMSWIGGELGALGGKAVVAGVKRIAPDALSALARTPLKELIKRPTSDFIPSTAGTETGKQALSLSTMGESTTKSFGRLSGYMLPSAIVANYKLDTNHIAWGGVARDSGEMGALALAIDTIPFTWGILRGKITRGLGVSADTSITPNLLDKSLEAGLITKDEHQWYKDYLEHQKDPVGNADKMPELEERATQIAGANGHTVNSVSNEAQFNIVKPETIKNLQGAIADQITTNMPDELKKTLSDFMVHNDLDDLMKDPTKLDGVRGYVDHIDQKLATKDTKLAEADEILDKHLTKGMTDSMPMSQKEIVKAMRKAGLSGDHVKNLPISIPKNVLTYIKMLKAIDDLKSTNRKLFRKFKRTGDNQHVEKMKANEAKIESIQGSLPEIQNPREELNSLRDELLSPEGRKMNPAQLQRSVAYQRLLDLSNVWHNARSLLDRVHLEHEYNRQSAFHDIAKQVLDISDANLPKLSRPENVIDYLKNRIEGNLKKVEDIKDVEAEVRTSHQVPSDYDGVMTEQDKQMKNIDAKESKQDFEAIHKKINEFKSNEGVFKSLISCVMGALNA